MVISIISKEQRISKRNCDNSDYNDFSKVFSYEHLINSAFMCKKDVAWKASVQNYMLKVYSNTYVTHRELLEGKFKIKSSHEFDINERGKTRHIRSIHIRERIVQRCLCDYCLIPILRKTLIYDNGASLKNKGIDFTIRRIKTHMQRYYRKYGNVGYVLIFDYKNYFGSIRHDILIEKLKDYITDTKLLNLIIDFIHMENDEQGLGLGSQVSQILSLFFASSIDHYIKDVRKVEFYDRYSDDGIIIHHDKKYLSDLILDISKKANEYGLTINVNKTKIIKLEKGFTFVKKRFSINNNGQITVRICSKSITRQRRRIKKFHSKVVSGKMTYNNAVNSYKSWRGNVLRFKTYTTVNNMDKLFNRLFLCEGGSRCIIK